MLTETPNGKEIEVYGVKMSLPVPGPDDFIFNSHLPPLEQKWKREELPEVNVSDIEIFSGDEWSPGEFMEWEEAEREEYIKQTGTDPFDLDVSGNPKPVKGIDPDPHFVFDVLQDFRDTELDRVDPWTGGVFAMIKGIEVWISPYHYFYIKYWRLEGGYPEWRWIDAQRFYYWQYAFEHNFCYGMTEASKRGDGKTYRGTAIQYLTTIFKKNCHSGIQSMTADDAEELFSVKMAEPYKDLPQFLIPINSNPSNPVSGLKFFPSAKSGKNAAVHRMLQRKAIRSRITWRDASDGAYDGTTINGVLFRDEEGKVLKQIAHVLKRHGVTKDCVYRDGKLLGKIYSTTTVEEWDKGGSNYQALWNQSDPSRRNELGETTSGLFRLFFPAYLTEHQDEWGFPDKERAHREQSIKRASFKTSPIALQKYILQYPWNEQELFSVTGITCQYNLEILRMREQFVNDPDFNEVRTGHFFFIDDTVGNPVEWQDDELNGRWNVYKFPPHDIRNNVLGTERAGKKDYYPNNQHIYCGGFDPTKGHSNPDQVRSKAGGAILLRDSIFDATSPNFVADYVWEPDDPEKAYMEFLAGCWFYGCQFLPETNLGINPVLRMHNAQKFMMERPEDTRAKTTRQQQFQEEIGLPSNVTVNDLLLKYKKSWMFHNAHKLALPRIIRDSISFDPAKRRKFDLEVATQLAIAAATKVVEQKTEKTDLSQIWTVAKN